MNGDDDPVAESEAATVRRILAAVAVFAPESGAYMLSPWDSAAEDERRVWSEAEREFEREVVQWANRPEVRRSGRAVFRTSRALVSRWREAHWGVRSSGPLSVVLDRAGWRSDQLTVSEQVEAYERYLRVYAREVARLLAGNPTPQRVLGKRTRGERRTYEHGKHRTYELGCRCEACRGANRDRMRTSGAGQRYKARVRDERVEINGRMVHPGADTPHGTRNGYNTYRCRCPACTEAGREHRRARVRLSR